MTIYKWAKLTHQKDLDERGTRMAIDINAGFARIARLLCWACVLLVAAGYYVFFFAHNLPGKDHSTWFESLFCSTLSLGLLYPWGKGSVPLVTTRPWASLFILAVVNAFYFWAMYYVPPMDFGLLRMFLVGFAPYVAIITVWALLRYIVSGFVRKTN